MTQHRYGSRGWTLFPRISFTVMTIATLTMSMRRPNAIPCASALSLVRPSTTSQQQHRSISPNHQPRYHRRNHNLRFYSSTTCLRATSPKTTPSSSSGAASTTATTNAFDQELVDLRRLFTEATTLYETNRASTTPLHQLQEALVDLEQEQSQPEFWDENNQARAQQVNAQVSTVSRLVAKLEQWERWHGDAQAALDMIVSVEDSEETQHLPSSSSSLSSEEREMLMEECHEACQLLLQDSKRYELDLLLSGPYDQAPARLVLTAGVGGTEANDWVADLKRMYERHCDQMEGFTCVTEDSQPGDVVGYKSVDLLITGPNAFGWLQGEKGAHRLVRLSPFNANNKRQTTFAGVDVAPADLLDSVSMDLDIPENDLEITAMRAGGKGGQNVNKVNSAVRIKHLPSGLQVKCGQERSQAQNKDIAMRRLKAQLLAILQEQQLQKIQQIKGDVVQASFGAQIRNYILHPYKMVKDARTGWETSNAQAFLDGDLLDECIGAYLRHKAKQQQEDAEDESKG